MAHVPLALRGRGVRAVLINAEARTRAVHDDVLVISLPTASAKLLERSEKRRQTRIELQLAILYTFCTYWQFALASASAKFASHSMALTGGAWDPLSNTALNPWMNELFTMPLATGEGLGGAGWARRYRAIPIDVIEVRMSVRVEVMSRTVAVHSFGTRDA